MERRWRTISPFGITIDGAERCTTPMPGSALLHINTIRSSTMHVLNRDEMEYEIEGCSLRDIINFNEYLVLKVIKDLLDSNVPLCRCSLCIEDVFALALNSLPPRYIQITSLERYTASENFIDEKKVKEKVMDAWERISKNPAH